MSKGAIAVLLLQYRAFMTVLMRVLVRVSVVVGVAMVVAMAVACVGMTKRCKTHNVHNETHNTDNEEFVQSV